MIPKRMAFFWSGPTLPLMRFLSIWSFRRLNPDWEIVLYFSPSGNKERDWESGERQDFESLQTCRCFMGRVASLGVDIEPWVPSSPLINSLSPIRQSDFCRWKALHEHGGFFSDTDVLFVDSFDSIYNNIGDKSLVLSIATESLPTGIVGGVAKSEFWANCYRAAKALASTQQYRSGGANALLEVAGLLSTQLHFDKLATRIRLEIAATVANSSICFIKPQAFYLFDEYKITELLHNSREVSEDTIGLHWHGGSRLAQKCIREVCDIEIAISRPGTVFEYTRDLVATFGKLSFI